jgi:hypothetical protein
MRKMNGWWGRWIGGMSTIFSHLEISVTILYRQIFPDKPWTKNKGKENDNPAEPDPDSIRSKAKHARLERAKKRQRTTQE